MKPLIEPPDKTKWREGDAWRAKFFRQLDVLWEPVGELHNWRVTQYKDYMVWIKDNMVWIKDNIARKESITEHEYDEGIKRVKIVVRLLLEHKV